jgi:hypothetical protein
MAGTQLVASIVKGPAEASRCLDVSKAAHRIGALLDATMILLNPIIEIVITAWMTSFPKVSRMARG